MMATASRPHFSIQRNREHASTRITMVWTVWLSAVAMLALAGGPLPAGEVLLIDEFDDVSDWRLARNISGEGACQLAVTPRAKVGAGAMLVTDRCPAPHAQWLEKRCPQGTWDLSKWQKVHLWVRGDGSHLPVYFKVLDEAGRLMFWEMGRMGQSEWQCFTVDLTRDQSLDRHENPNLARIATVGVRFAPHCQYKIALDDLWLSDPAPAAVAPSSDASVGERIGYLAPRHVNDIKTSIVGVNLHPGVGELTEEDIDALAAAGVKWAARLPLDLNSPYGKNVRRALLKHRFNLHGIFSVKQLLTGRELATRLQKVRSTVAGLKHIVHHWEIGNEPNIGKFWSDHPNATEFGQMVCAFAEAIRAEQPEAVIISGGLVGYPLDFGEQMMDTGMGQWVDYIGIHTPRNRPEDGGGGRDHAQALEQFRKLIRSYDPKLEVWQSEVQATPNVTFADVRGGITDFQQARHVARRFFIEQWLDYPASFWQLFKAGTALDHPGALMRVDGTPTMKFFAIQNVAAILDKRLERADVPVCVEQQEKPTLLAEHSAPTFVQPGEEYVGPAFTVPYGTNVDMQLTAETAAETIDTRLIWLDKQGQEVVSVSRTNAVPAKPGPNTVCRHYPHAFRPVGATHARIKIGAPKNTPMRIKGLRVIAYRQFVDARAYAFRRRDDGALFVPYSLAPRPPVDRVESTCNLRIGGTASAFSEPVLVDMIDGTVRRVKAPRTETDGLVFESLPITDYSLVLTDARWLRTQPRSCLLSHFDSPSDMLRQFVSDQFGRGRPEFWRLLDDATTGGDYELAAILDKAKRVFRTQLEPADGQVEVQGLSLVTRQLRPSSWRSSIVNDKSQHADRYFVQIRCASVEESGLRVLADGRPMKHRRWRDDPANIGTWMATDHAGAVRVFVGVPDGEAMREDIAIEYRVCPCTARTFPFRDRRNRRPCAINLQDCELFQKVERPTGADQTNRAVARSWPAARPPCVVFWCNPFEELAMPEGTVRLIAPNGSLPRAAVIINLVTGEHLGGVETVESGENREVRGVPIGCDPLLIAARDG